MAQHKRHTSILDDKLEKEIEALLARLKSPRTKRQVQNWLENFESNEIDLALNFLLFLDYITFEDLQHRLEPLLENIEKQMKGNEVLFVPYGKYGKSNDLVIYCITKSSIFKKHYNKSQFQHTRDLFSVKLQKPTILVFVDDFIGSGNSFVKWYQKKKFQTWLSKNSGAIADQVLMCPEIMQDGHDHIKTKYSKITLFGNIRNKIFDTKSSPFRVLGNLKEMKDLCIKYGSIIPVGYSLGAKVYTPLGYDNSESLLTFDYGTPNNTLSIIWGATNWYPIFPRIGKDRIKMVKEAKKDSSHFMALIRKFGVSISEDEKIVVGKTPILINSQEDHGLLCFLIFKNKGYSNPEISQNIGVSIQILESIIKTGRRKKLLGKDENITKIGDLFLREIYARAHKFRENDPLNDKSKTVFVPLNFNNTT